MAAAAHSTSCLAKPVWPKAPGNAGLGITASRLALQSQHLAPTQHLLFGCDHHTYCCNWHKKAPPEIIKMIKQSWLSDKIKMRSWKCAHNQFFCYCDFSLADFEGLDCVCVFMWLTVNLEPSVGGYSLLCLIYSITAVVSHVVTRCQDQNQLSSHAAIKGRLLQCPGHDPSVLKQEGRTSHMEEFVYSRRINTHINIHMHAVLHFKPGQSPGGIPSGGETDEMDRCPWAQGDMLWRSIKPYLLRGIWCLWMNQKLECWKNAFILPWFCSKFTFARSEN